MDVLLRFSFCLGPFWLLPYPHHGCPPFPVQPDGLNSVKRGEEVMWGQGLYYKFFWILETCLESRINRTLRPIRKRRNQVEFYNSLFQKIQLKVPCAGRWGWSRVGGRRTPLHTFASQELFIQIESESQTGGAWPSPCLTEWETEVQRLRTLLPLLSSRWITLWALHWWWASSSGFRRKPTLLQTTFQPLLRCSCCMGESCGPLANGKGSQGRSLLFWQKTWVSSVQISF